MALSRHGQKTQPRPSPIVRCNMHVSQGSQLATALSNDTGSPSAGWLKPIQARAAEQQPAARERGLPISAILYWRTMNSRRLLLQHISNNDGSWGWYQLDRALSFEGISGIHLPTELAWLVANGHALCDGDPKPASSHYRITAAGMAVLGEAPAFEFHTSTPSSLHVKIDSSISDPTALLQSLSEQLRFPDYFGMNWNALVDCLSDLSWLEDESEVAIIHHSLPTLPKPELETYIECLHDALERHTFSDPRLRVIFHPDLETVVRSFLPEHDEHSECVLATLRS